MNWKKAIGYGVGIYAVIFVIISALLGVTTSVYLGLVLGIVVPIIATYLYKPGNTKTGLQVGLVWVVTALVLDFLITTQFVADIFSHWTVWVGYAIMLLAPAVIPGVKLNIKPEAK